MGILNKLIKKEKIMVFALLAAQSEGTEDSSPFFFAYMGVASALVFANLGASYGTAKSGVGISSLGVIDHTKIFKALIPIIMAGILGIYGIIVSVLLNGSIKPEMTDAAGYKILGAGLCCG